MYIHPPTHTAPPTKRREGKAGLASCAGTGPSPCWQSSSADAVPPGWPAGGTGGAPGKRPPSTRCRPSRALRARAARREGEAGRFRPAACKQATVAKQGMRASAHQASSRRRRTQAWVGARWGKGAVAPGADAGFCTQAVATGERNNEEHPGSFRRRPVLLAAHSATATPCFARQPVGTHPHLLLPALLQQVLSDRVDVASKEIHAVRIPALRRRAKPGRRASVQRAAAAGGRGQHWSAARLRCACQCLLHPTRSRHDILLPLQRRRHVPTLGFDDSP